MPERACPSVPGVEPVAPRSSALSERRTVVYIVLGLIVAMVCAYALSVRADFIDFDDNSHVFENPLVKGGLSWSGIGAAFTKFHASLWVPLTWISFMADVTFFGLNPGAMHAVNLAWHTASTVLLFLTLRRMTGSLWASAFVAGLFGLHPLNVESVAWIAERKNVLSTFFWFAALAAYARYAEQGRPLWYVTALAAAACALLSKPMAVTLPCTLLLLDFWPLARWRGTSWLRLFVEKIPLFLLTAGSCWMTLHAPRDHAVVTTTTLPLLARLSNALVSYVAYLGNLFWPTRLAVFYPHPIAPQVALDTGAGLLLLAITALVLRQRKQQPYLLMGWLWFLGVLVPVIGLVQVGSQARADRFTYVPQIGIFLALTWWAKERWAASPCVLRLMAGSVLFACALLTAHQVTYWLDGVTLFERAIAVTDNNACAYANAGLHRARVGEPAKAIEHYQASLRIQPDQPMIWREFGRALVAIKKPQEAVAAYRTALQYDATDLSARYQLGVALQQSGALDEAIAQLEQILREVPHSAGGHYHLGLALEKKGRMDEARAHLREAARLAPTDAEIAEALRRLEAPPAA